MGANDRRPVLMSRSGEIVLAFGGEDRKFRLGIGEWRDVQEKCDAGPGEIMERLSPAFRALKLGVSFADLLHSGIVGRWRIDDIRVVIFAGLVGGGMDPTKSLDLVRKWVDERPILEPLPIAYEIVYASLAGAPDEEAAAGEPKGETGPPLSPEASSGSAETASTPRAARSGSRRAKSTN